MFKSLNFYGALKSHAAGISAAVSLAMTDLATSGTISLDQWYGLIGAALGVAAVTYAVPNTKAEDSAPGA